MENYTIISKSAISEMVHRHVLYAPLVAAKARAGQFVILRALEDGERVPITIAEWDASAGTITVFIQSTGKSTRVFNSLREGERFLTIAGPLGVPTEIRKYGTVVCVGGGVGIAEVCPIAKALKNAGNKIISVLGARTRELLILETEMRSVSSAVYLATDDGTLGEKGVVTAPLARVLESGEKIDRVFTIGPLPMMRAVAELTRPYNIPTFASMNPIILDGTGMCGGCRLEVGGKVQFACVDGPIFDAHQVNFEQAMARSSAYKETETASLENYKKHTCKLDN